MDKLLADGSEEKVDPKELHELSEASPELEATDLGEVVEAGGAVLRAGVDEDDREGGMNDDAASEVDSAMIASPLLNPFTFGIPKGLLAPPELPGLLLLLLFLPPLLSPKKRDILNAGAVALPVNDKYDTGLYGEVVVDVANVTVCTTCSFVAAEDDDAPAYDRLRELLAVRACSDCSANSSWSSLGCCGGVVDWTREVLKRDAIPLKSYEARRACRVLAGLNPVSGSEGSPAGSTGACSILSGAAFDAVA